MSDLEGDPCLKSNISPMFLTYHMVDWNQIEQESSDHRCTDCGRPMMKTEPVVDEKGLSYEGYVCHADKRVTWMKVG